jgi:ribonuclease P/MRP protein subunit POP5
MKPFPSVLKPKHRYVAFQMYAKQRFTEKQTLHSIWEIMFDLYGEEGIASTDFWVMDYDEKKMSGTVRCRVGDVDRVIVALTLIKDIQGKKACCWVTGLSGTVKKAREKFLN